MDVFNLRLSKELQLLLDAAARERGQSRSEVVRDALTAHLGPAVTADPDCVVGDDDWNDFGTEVIAAHKQLLSELIDTLAEREWSETVEKLYALFRRKVIETSAGHQSPYLTSFALKDVAGPRVGTIIAFAADDIISTSMTLEQLFIEYAWCDGMDAFAEIPAIWEAAKARLDSGEPDPSSGGWAKKRQISGV